MIEFQFFDGCPNCDDTLRNLHEAMMEQQIATDYLKVTEIPDVESAKRTNFQGSPTILLNGKDLITGQPPAGYTYSCRVYEFDGEQTGLIPKDFIAAKLKDIAPGSQ